MNIIMNKQNRPRITQNERFCGHQLFGFWVSGADSQDCTSAPAAYAPFADSQVVRLESEPQLQEAVFFPL